MSIAQKFGTPFYTGLGQSAPSVPFPYAIAIAGHRYTVDWSMCTRGIISPMRDSRDMSALPGEAALNPMAAWKRNRDDWTLGSGQVWGDRALEPYNVKIELEPRQFRYSKGIDPWTVGQFKLLPDTEVFYTTGNSLMKILTIGTTYFYIVDGATLKRTQDPTAASVVWTTITGLSGTIYDLTTDGYYVYIATSVGVYKHDSSTTTAAPMGGAASTTVANNFLTWANGWLFIGVGNILYTIDNSGNLTNVMTHPNPQFIWYTCAGAPSAIYVAGQPPGDMCSIYSINIQSTGQIGVPIHALSLPRAEAIRSMRYYATYMMLATNRGIRCAEIGSNSVLIISPIVLTPNEVRQVVADGHQMWWTYTNVDGSSTGVGRSDLSLSSDINSFIPSYASDLMFAGQGQVQTVARFNGQTYFAVYGSGYIRQERTGKFVPSGMMSMGRYRWGTYEPKVFLGIETTSDPLVAGSSVSKAAILDDGSSVQLGLRDNAGSIGLGTIYGIGVIATARDWIDPQITLNADAATRLNSPVIHRLTIRALPSPKVVEQFQMAIEMAENVDLESGEGQDKPYDTQAEYDFLKSLIVNAIPITFQIGEQSYFCTVRDLQWPEKMIKGFNFQRTGFNGILVVTLITAEM